MLRVCQAGESSEEQKRQRQDGLVLVFTADDTAILPSWCEKSLKVISQCVGAEGEPSGIN